MGFILNIIAALIVLLIQPLKNSAELITSIIWLIFKPLQLIWAIIDKLLPKSLMSKLNYIPTTLVQVTKMVAIKMIDLISPRILQLISDKIKNRIPNIQFEEWYIPISEVENIEVQSIYKEQDKTEINVDKNEIILKFNDIHVKTKFQIEDSHKNSGTGVAKFPMSLVIKLNLSNLFKRVTKEDPNISPISMEAEIKDMDFNFKEMHHPIIGKVGAEFVANRLSPIIRRKLQSELTEALNERVEIFEKKYLDRVDGVMNSVLAIVFLFFFSSIMTYSFYYIGGVISTYVVYMIYQAIKHRKRD